MIEFINREDQQIKLASNSRYAKFQTADFNQFFQKLENFLNKKPIYGLLIKKYTDHILDIPIGKTSEILQAIKERISLYTKDITEARFEDILLYNRRDQIVYSIDYTNKYLHNYYTFYKAFQLSSVGFSELEKNQDEFCKRYNQYLRDRLFNQQVKYSEEKFQTYKKHLKELRFKILTNKMEDSTKETIGTLSWYQHWLTLPIEYA